MKKYLLLPVSVTIIASAFFASNAEPIRLTDFKQAKPASIKYPVIGDSTSKAGFSAANLLKYNWNGDFTTVAPGTSAPDTTGFLHIAKPQTDAIISGLKTHLKADHFVKGKLVITSPMPFQAFADEKSLGSKETSEDSISSASTKQFDLDLQPEYVTEIVIKVVAEADSKCEPTIKVEYIPDEKFNDVKISQGAEMKKRVSIQTTVEGPRVVSSLLSPDGKYLLTSYAETFSPTNARHWATLSETATGKILNADLDTKTYWMPKGNKLVSVVKNGDLYDIFLTEVPSMKRTLFAENIPTSSFDIAPDESYLVYNDIQQGKNENGPMKRIKSPDDRIPGNRDRVYLMKYSIKDGITQPLTLAGPSTTLCDISSDSRKLLYVSVQETPSKHPFYANSIISLDVNTLQTDTIVKDDTSIAGAVFSPDAKQIFAWGGPTAFNGIGANKGDNEMPNDFDIQGYIVNIADRKVSPVTKDFNPSILGKPVWNISDGKIYFLAYDKFFTPIYSLEPRSGKFSRLDIPIDKVTNFSIGRMESKWLTCTGQSYTQAGALYRTDLKSGKTTMVDNPMQEILSDINFGQIEGYKFKASDGTEIDTDIILPPDFDPTRKYPMIVYYYGGTLPSGRSFATPYSPQLFASRDYVVFVINPSGAIGYGQEFSGRHVNAWGKRTSDDIIEGVNDICKKYQFIDDKKIGCIGASYGGFMTQYLLTKTDIFAAAISHAGISNVTSYWGEGFWGYSYNSVAAAKSYPWTNPDLFTKQGSLFNADKIHTPLLLLHGTVDTNVPIGESVQLFNALKILGRDVEFITVEDQNHIIMDYEKRVLWHATIMAWFAKWLQDDPRWWDSMYGK